MRFRRSVGDSSSGDRSGRQANMVGGAVSGGAAQAVSIGVRRTIQSIKEVIGGHSDEDIYAVLRESNMDPNETAQKLLNQDPFHEVKRKRDKKKENTRQQNLLDVTANLEPKTQVTKVQSHWNQNEFKRVYAPNNSAGVGPQFRVVKDNRVPSSIKNGREEHAAQAGNNPLTALFIDGSLVQNGPKHEQATGSGQGMVEKYNNMASRSSSNASRLSTSDPVHVPSSSRPSANIGAIHRQIAQSSGERLSANQSDAEKHSVGFPVDVNLQKTRSATGRQTGHPVPMYRNNASNQRPMMGFTFRGRPIGRFSSARNNVNKFQQVPSVIRKASRVGMEWKPKSVKGSVVVDSSVNQVVSATPILTTDSQDIIDLSDKISRTSLLEEHHVIIPVHLRIPESEQTGLRFGSFASDADSIDSVSLCSTTEPVVATEIDKIISSPEHVNEQSAPLHSDQSISNAEHAEELLEIHEDLNAGVDNYDAIGLVESSVPLLPTVEAQNMQTTSIMPVFTELDHEAGTSMPLFRSTEHDAHLLRLPSASEASSSQQIVSRPAPISAQQQQLVQSQTAAQLYPPVHSHYPNFVPFRHVYSPVYVPQIAVPNYSANIAYTHPTNGNNFLPVAGASSHVGAAGMKYGMPQYKTVPGGNPVGYGNYTHPNGYAVSSPGVIGGAVGIDDMNRTKYKDNIYASNPQVETSDLWLQQTPREIAPLHLPPFYNLPGQAMTAGFIPNAGNASFNPAPSPSHGQFPGLYHQPQPGSLVSPHHLVHQQVPSALGGNVAAAPGPQVGPYQQTSLSHLNWRPNF